MNIVLRYLHDTDCAVSCLCFWCHLDAVARLAICRGARGAMDGPRMDTAHRVVANHHRSGIDAIDGGARCGKKRNQGATELPARFGWMAPTRGYRATIGNGDCGVHRARGRRRESVYPVTCDSDDVCRAACHRRCRRGAWLARLPAASPGKRFGEMTAAWVMAILWSLWHVAAFFVPGMPHQIMPPLSTLLFVALFGVFLAFVFNRAGESVLATILAHLSLNIASGFGGVQLSSIVFWRTLVAIFGALALLIALTSRRRPQNAPAPVQAE